MKNQNQPPAADEAAEKIASRLAASLVKATVANKNATYYELMLTALRENPEFVRACVSHAALVEEATHTGALLADLMLWIESPKPDAAAMRILIEARQGSRRLALNSANGVQS
jgi:hypothetical protein